ncbi:MAG: trehalose-phosphatase [Deltaproteobacteria bacterium]
MAAASGAGPGVVDWQQLASVPHLVIALDLDGTLIPFAPTPHDARIDGDTAELLHALAASPGVTLGLVSGRPRDMMEDLPARFPSIALAAEHGVWRCGNGVWEAALPPVPQLDEIERSLRSLAARYQGTIVERKSCSVCLHWRLVASTEHASIMSSAEVLVDEWLETNGELERLPVVEAIEIRHRAAHKGVALGWLRGRGPADSTVLAIGDDTTDEDMFVSLRERDLGILVAHEPRRTDARFRLPDVNAVHGFLRWLIESRARRHVMDPEIALAHPSGPRGEPKLIVASNRLPNLSGGRGKEVGGLVSAIAPALGETQGIWLGWSGLERDPGLRVRLEHGEPVSRAQFDYPPSWRQRFYAGFCNQSLWPLLHGFVGRVRYVDDEWACYCEVNRAYAAAIQQVGGNAAEVWVQDFHLMLVGAELARLGHTGTRGFYLHVPFMPLDIFATMPWAAEIVTGLLAYDLVGVQCERWRENLIASARGLLGSDAGKRAGEIVRTIPVGIDPDRIAEAAASTATTELGSYETMLAGRKLILGVDRLDYSKGIPERLEAFARMLERFPEWRGKVSLIQVSVPTRSDVPDYAELRSRVESLVGRINGAYGEADWTPVRYLYRSYDQDTLAKLYRFADVGLVTPLRDGMNLVAKEFVAAQDPDDPGVLVLSKFAGAAERMTEAIVTNPYHADGMASDLDRALRAERTERVARNESLRRVVWEDSAAAWTRAWRAALHGLPRLQTGTERG